MHNALSTLAEPSQDELDKLFSLAAGPWPGPHEEEYHRVCKVVVPKMQPLIRRLRTEAQGRVVSNGQPKSQGGKR